MTNGVPQLFRVHVSSLTLTYRKSQESISLSLSLSLSPLFLSVFLPLSFSPYCSPPSATAPLPLSLLTHSYKYRIAENFRGRKLSRIVRRKLSRNVKSGRIMGVACLEYCGENFRGWLENREIRESFPLESFPLYSTFSHLRDSPRIEANPGA